MNGWIEVTRRELHGRRVLWIAALSLGLLALASPLLFTSDSGPATAALFAILFTAFLAFGVGGAMIGGELSERRLSFYFTRPLSGRAIFFGKLAAAALLTYGSQLLIWLPTSIVNHHVLGGTLVFGGGLALGTPLLLALGLVAGIVARCRSRWLLADLAIGVGLMALIVFLLFEGMVVLELGWISTWTGMALIGGTGAGVAAALFAGAAVAVIHGRTDSLRAHRLMTIVAAAALVPVSSVALGASARLLRPRLADVKSVQVANAAPHGDWVHLAGALTSTGNTWAPDFLFNPATGSSRRLGFTSDVAPAFSDDGRFVAWVELTNLYGAVVRDTLAIPEMTLVVRALDAGTEVRAEVAIKDLAGVGWSPDGQLLAIVGEHEVELRSAATLHLVAQAKSRKGTSWKRARFVSPTRLRLFASDDAGVDVVDLRADTRGADAVTHLATKGPSVDLRVSPAGDRLLIQEPDDSVRLWSIADGAALALETPPHRGLCGGFLPDGRIAIGHGNLQGSVESRLVAWVRIYSREGQLEHTLDLGAGVVSCVVESNGLLVAVNPRPSPRDENQRLSFVNADRGTVSTLDPRLRRLGESRSVFETAPPARLLVGDAEGGLDEWDPATASTRALVHGRHL